MENNTDFGKKGVNSFELDWTQIAETYKTHLRQSQQEKIKTATLRAVFCAWHHGTEQIKKQKIAQTGRLCAQIAAARAEGSTEEEFILGLI